MRNALVGQYLEFVYQSLFAISDLCRDRQRKNPHRDRPAQIIEKARADIEQPSAMSRRDIDKLEHSKDIAVSTGVNIIPFKDREQPREIWKCEFRMILDATVDRP